MLTHLRGFGVEDLGCLLQAGSFGFAVKGLWIVPGPTGSRVHGDDKAK